MSSKYNIGLKNPYGVMPNGNRLLDGIENEYKRRRSLGIFSGIPEQILVDILFYLSIEEICTMLKVSKVLYVYCHFNELWRDITLRKYPGDFYFKKSWKDTCAMIELKRRGKVNQFQYHVPLEVPFMCSDLMHRSWVCRSFDVESACKDFLALDNLPSRDASLTRKEFVEQFEIPNIPVVVRKCTSSWKLNNSSLWTQKENPTGNCNEKYYKATSLTSSVPMDVKLTFDQYISYATQAFEESPLYLFDNHFICPAATDGHTKTVTNGSPEKVDTTDIHANGITENDYSIPVYFDSAQSTVLNDGSLHLTDLLRVLTDDPTDAQYCRKRPDFRWLIAGGVRSGSVFHKDPNATCAWNAIIKGRKKWIFYPPDFTPPGIFASSDEAEFAVPVSIGEWMLSFWNDHLENRKLATSNSGQNVGVVGAKNGGVQYPMECVAEEGDCVFVPAGWWHMVVNLDDTVAITQNYVSTSNLSNALKFFRDCPEQISGISMLERTKAESKAENAGKIAYYNPNEIYDVLVGKLKKLPYTDNEFPVDHYIEVSKKKESRQMIPNQINHKKRSHNSLADALIESNKKTTQENQFQFSFF